MLSLRELAYQELPRPPHPLHDPKLVYRNCRKQNLRAVRKRDGPAQHAPPLPLSLPMSIRARCGITAASEVQVEVVLRICGRDEECADNEVEKEVFSGWSVLETGGLHLVKG